MLIESLARLALVHESCKENGIQLVSQSFMDETQEIIDSQVKILQNDLAFQTENPGPYYFKVKDRTIHLFPPVFTESPDWVMIVVHDETEVKEKIFIFHSLLGLIENLGNAFNYIENASTSTQNPES